MQDPRTDPKPPDRPSGRAPAADPPTDPARSRRGHHGRPRRPIRHWFLLVILAVAGVLIMEALRSRQSHPEADGSTSGGAAGDREATRAGVDPRQGGRRPSIRLGAIDLAAVPEAAARRIQRAPTLRGALVPTAGLLAGKLSGGGVGEEDGRSAPSRRMLLVHRLPDGGFAAQEAGNALEIGLMIDRIVVGGWFPDSAGLSSRTNTGPRPAVGAVADAGEAIPVRGSVTAGFTFPSRAAGGNEPSAANETNETSARMGLRVIDPLDAPPGVLDLVSEDDSLADDMVLEWIPRDAPPATDSGPGRSPPAIEEMEPDGAIGAEAPASVE